MTDKMYFYLTDHQSKFLAPLFEEMHKVSTNGYKGMILAQIEQNDHCVAGFIPGKYATKIRAITREMESK